MGNRLTEGNVTAAYSRVTYTGTATNEAVIFENTNPSKPVEIIWESEVGLGVSATKILRADGQSQIIATASANLYVGSLSVGAANSAALLGTSSLISFEDSNVRLVLLAGDKYVESSTSMADTEHLTFLYRTINDIEVS